MQQNRRPIVNARTNLFIDITIFVAFLIATAPRFTGITIHEWLGIAFAAAIIVHLLVHWQWIIAVGKKLFSKAQANARINYLLNILLFIDITLISFTGLMISEAALPLFGIHMQHNPTWTRIHSLTSDAGVFIVALHIGLHWQWVLKTTARLLGLKPRQPKTQPVSDIVSSEVSQ